MIDEIPFLFRLHHRNKPHSDSIRSIDESGKLYRVVRNVSACFRSKIDPSITIHWRTIPGFNFSEQPTITLREV
jgi:hypothetical protein